MSRAVKAVSMLVPPEPKGPWLAKKYTKIYHFNAGFIAAFQ
jgi:hypothetical protein